MPREEVSMEFDSRSGRRVRVPSSADQRLKLSTLISQVAAGILAPKAAIEEINSPAWSAYYIITK